MPPRRRNPSRPRVAGIHLDGATATLVEVTNPDSQPKVLHVTQHTGFTPPEALTKALTGLPHDVPARVTFTAPGTHTSPIDVTSSILGNRAEFEALARRTVAQLDPLSAVAAVLPVHLDEDALTRGLALVAPNDIVTSLQRAADIHPRVEVTLTPAAYGLLPGLHLALRRHSCELVLVRDNRAVRAHTLPTAGSAAIAAQLGDEQRLTGILTGTQLDVAGSEILRQWFAHVAADLASTLTEWAYAGEPVATLDTLLVHGHMANSGLLDEALKPLGLRRDPHPLVGLPHTAPLDAVDAYMAAVTAARDTPTAALATFPNTLPATSLATRRNPAARTPRTRDNNRRRFSTLTPGRTAAAAALILLASTLSLAPQGWATYQASTAANTTEVAVTTRPDSAAALAAAEAMRFAAASLATNTGAAAALAQLANQNPDARYAAQIASRLQPPTDDQDDPTLLVTLTFTGPDAAEAAQTAQQALEQSAPNATPRPEDIELSGTTLSWTTPVAGTLSSTPERPTRP